LTARIAKLENICGLKCSRPIPHYAKVKSLCGDSIVISHPAESESLMLMRDHGQRVHMSSAAPFLYQVAGWLPMRDYTELALEGRFAEAEQASKQLDSLRPVHEKWLRDPWHQNELIPIHYLKAWSELLGMAGGPVRPPLPQVTAEERAEMRKDLEQAGLLARVPAAARAKAA
jgi:4-hydroxy-tetrahydrodipicolinate synthase